MRIQLLYFPALSVIFFHNTYVLASSLTLRGKDKPDEWKPLVKLNIENEKNLLNQVYSHTNAKVGLPVTSGWLQDELVSATTVYLKDMSSEPSQEVHECDIILTEENSSIVEMAYRHGKGANIEILAFDVPVSGHLTRIEVETLAHDQNTWGRCSYIQIRYYNPAEEYVKTFWSSLVPRSGTYKLFSWNQDTNYAVERGGVLKLCGNGCNGAGIHTKNTLAKVVITKDNCAPSFYYKRLKPKFSKKCMTYVLDQGYLNLNLYCDSKFVQSFSSYFGNNELIAGGGGKENECVTNHSFRGSHRARLQPCDGSDEQFIEWSDGVIKNTPNNQCLRLYSSSFHYFYLRFGDCDEEAIEFELV